jgi:hypothetical protein
MFWINDKQGKPILGNEALKVLLPCCTAYWCKAEVSALSFTKTKLRSRLQPERDLKCSLSNTRRRFEELSKLMQN